MGNIKQLLPEAYNKLREVKWDLRIDAKRTKEVLKDNLRVYNVFNEKHEIVGTVIFFPQGIISWEKVEQDQIDQHKDLVMNALSEAFETAYRI